METMLQYTRLSKQRSSLRTCNSCSRERRQMVSAVVSTVSNRVALGCNRAAHGEASVSAPPTADAREPMETEPQTTTIVVLRSTPTQTTT